MRVRLFQKRTDGPFLRAVWIAGSGMSQKSLGTKNREEALRLGKLLFAELLRGDQGKQIAAPLTLGELWRRFSTDCADYLDNKPRSRNDAEARSRVLMGYFGKDFLVEDFTVDDQRRYEQARMAGGIVTTKGEKTVKTRARSAEADIVVLHAMLRWATTVRVAGKRYLLDRNPLLYVRRVREKNKKQPCATWERYSATLEAMRVFHTLAKTNAERLRWKRMQLALYLAERTGRRLGAIRQLRWEDFQFDGGRVFWRAEADKKGYDWQVQMPKDFFTEIRSFQRELGAITGPIFATDGARDGIMDRHLFDKWLIEAERKATLPKLDGSAWHAYRRKWAIERKGHNPKDVAAAGGWKDVATLLEVYQQPDEKSVLAVMSETKKLRERGVA
jgi:integrase